MATSAQDVAVLRQRAEAANAERISAEARATAAEEEYERARAAVQAEFGVADEEALANLIATEQARLDEEAARARDLLDAADAAVKALPA